MRCPSGVELPIACFILLSTCFLIITHHDDTQQVHAKNITGTVGGIHVTARLQKQPLTLRTTPDYSHRNKISNTAATREHQYRQLPTFDLARSLLCNINIMDLCICDEAGLRQSIQNAIPYKPDNSNSSATTAFTSRPASVIHLCRNSQITLTAAIDISGKSIDIQCPKEATGILGRRESHCSIDANHGGRIFVGEDAQLRISGVDLRNAAAVPLRDGDSGTDGGAIRLFHSHIVISACTFSQNEALQGAGGAVFVTGGSLVITGSKFRNNYGGDGGGIAAHDTIVNITDSSFERNKAASAAGAMIFRGGSIVIRSTMITENTANTARYGGALACANSKILIVHSVFSGNRALSVQSNDISIYDNEPFEKGGTRITCDRNTTFCDGVEGIFDANGQSNTNCVNVGQIGIPGQYPCPA